MPAWCPTLVTSDSTIAAEIESDLSSRINLAVTSCDPDECRKQLLWHRPGHLVLVASRPDDLTWIARLARESALRQAPLKVAVVAMKAVQAEASLVDLKRLTDAWFDWPAGADELATLLAAECPTEPCAQSLVNDLSGRLSYLTPSLAHMTSRMALAAMHDVTILLTGETGTGKTYLARLLHDYSPRKDQPFLNVPCGAQPPELFASTFFGHVRGAFTGAHQAQKGKFAAAGKGTILLDEIETLGPDQQAALLRVIESGEYEKVGGIQTFKNEARLIVASNWDLEAAVERGQFRQDLFYRLNVLAFHLPPLRERRADIPLLARAFAATFSQSLGKLVTDIAPSAIDVLTNYPWRGNVRQLEHAMQEAVLLCGGSELTVDHLPISVRNFVAEAPSPSHVVVQGDPPHASNGVANARIGNGTLVSNRAEFERNLIQQALESCQNNRSSAARALGISRVTLHKKINQYGLRHPPTP